MTRRKLKRRVRLSRNDDILISVKAKVIVKVCRAIWGVFTRRKRARVNEEIERTRQTHLIHQHRLAKDRWRG